MMIFWIFFVGALDFGKFYWDFFVVLLVGFIDLSPSNVVGGSKQQLAHQDQDFSWCQPNELFWPGSWWVPRSQQRQLWMFHVTVDPQLSSFLLEKTLRFRRVMITFPAKYKLRSVNVVLHEPPKGWQLRWSLEHIGIFWIVLKSVRRTTITPTSSTCDRIQGISQAITTFVRNGHRHRHWSCSPLSV